MVNLSFPRGSSSALCMLIDTSDLKPSCQCSQESFVTPRQRTVRPQHVVAGAGHRPSVGLTYLFLLSRPWRSTHVQVVILILEWVVDEGERLVFTAEAVSTRDDGSKQLQ